MHSDFGYNEKNSEYTMLRGAGKYHLYVMMKDYTDYTEILFIKGKAQLARLHREL